MSSIGREMPPFAHARKPDRTSAVVVMASFYEDSICAARFTPPAGVKSEHEYQRGERGAAGECLHKMNEDRALPARFGPGFYGRGILPRLGWR